MKLWPLAFVCLLSAGCNIPPDRQDSAVQIIAAPSEYALNINTASIADLENLPGIGPKLAARIVDHRTRHGPFRKPEHLLLVDGFSETRFRNIRPLIKTE